MFIHSPGCWRKRDNSVPPCRSSGHRRYTRFAHAASTSSYFSYSSPCSYILLLLVPPLLLLLLLLPLSSFRFSSTPYVFRREAVLTRHANLHTFRAVVSAFFARIPAAVWLRMSRHDAARLITTIDV